MCDESQTAVLRGRLYSERLVLFRIQRSLVLPFVSIVLQSVDKFDGFLYCTVVKDCIYSQPSDSFLHSVRKFTLSVNQLDGCLDGLVVAQTLSSLVLQEKHLEMLDIHRPEDQKYFALSLKCSPPLGSLVPDVVVDERGRPCAVAVAFLPVCAVPVIVHLLKSFRASNLPVHCSALSQISDEMFLSARILYSNCRGQQWHE